MSQRMQNFLASTAWVMVAYFLHTRMPFFGFPGYMRFDFGEIFLNLQTNFLFLALCVLYILALFVVYCFGFYRKTASSVLAWRTLKKIMLFSWSAIQKSEKKSLLACLLKVYFGPLLTIWLFGNLMKVFSNASALLFVPAGTDFLTLFQAHWFWLFFYLILFVDTVFFAVGYLLELPSLKNTIRSVDSSWLGWGVVLLCYTPFNQITGRFLPQVATDFPYFENPWLFVGANVLILLLFSIYSWASVALGLKASNLTHRGIIGHGPYRYIRHPAYTCKVLTWWIGLLPFIGQQLVSQNVSLLLLGLSGMLGWTYLYYLRAITEEEHLLSVDDEYQKYTQKVPYRFIPKII